MLVLEGLFGWEQRKRRQFELVVLHFTYEEHAQRVQRQRQRVEAGPVQPDFGVFHCGRDVVPGHALVGDGVAVGFQAREDELFLLGCDEGCFRRPVHHVPPGGEGEDDGEKAFDYEDPSVGWSVDRRMCMADGCFFTSNRSGRRCLACGQYPRPECHRTHRPWKPPRRKERCDTGVQSVYTTGYYSQL